MEKRSREEVNSEEFGFEAKKREDNDSAERFLKKLAVTTNSHVDTGALNVVRSLEFKMSKVTIMCTDNDSSKPLTRNATLHVSISDINDETPKFEHPVYQGHVRENEPNAPVIHLTPSPTIRVADADAGRNALITFSLKEASGVEDSSNSTRRTSDVGHFRIDPRSGRLWTVPALDAEEQVDDASGEGRKYVFYVVATDDGVPERRSSSALMNIFVDDINDNPPAFENYHYNFESSIFKRRNNSTKLVTSPKLRSYIRSSALRGALLIMKDFANII
ncbi:hypothetical protein ACTXT7_007585 [Hymenolepis weldensis]